MTRHSFDPFSFVVGLLVVAIGVIHLVDIDLWGSDSGVWFVPVLLGSFGLGIIALAVSRVLQHFRES